MNGYELLRAAHQRVVDLERGLLTHFLGKPIGEGYENLVFALKDPKKVIKVKKPIAFKTDIQYRRPQEHTLIPNASTCIKTYGGSIGHLVVERLGSNLGHYEGFSEEFKQAPDKRIITFLEQLVEQLDANEIEHRDIHPGNILEAPESEYGFKLIDFSWARRKDKRISEFPRPLNQYYSPNDKAAIEKMIREVEAFYR